MTGRFEQARAQSIRAEALLRANFSRLSAAEVLDAEFFGADRAAALGCSGLPFRAPVCEKLLNDPEIAGYLAGFSGSQLLIWQNGEVLHETAEGVRELPPETARRIRARIRLVLEAPGRLNDKGELLLDLKAAPVGPHYAVNLLLGNRSGYAEPLCTTPKSALDAFGRGSFRAGGSQQVLATRCVLALEENGEPENRQFYLTENGKQIFYSANVRENVVTAQCRHSQNRTVITYETACGLAVKRTIFLLPQKPGLPAAVEAQRVELRNLGSRARTLKMVMTGMFGIAPPVTVANDAVYANLVMESEIYYEDGRAAAMTLHPKPRGEQNSKRFALLLTGGETMDEFCTSREAFVGGGSLLHPDLAARLPSRYSRKNAPFFAMGKQLTVAPGEVRTIDSLTGLMDAADGAYDSQLHALIGAYRNPAALGGVLQEIEDFWNRYPSYLTAETGEEHFDSFVNHNLPFQVLYQTFVSRGFAWTQKSYRETGFREIQDLYASMYYLSAMGADALIRELLGCWIRNVWRMGYAYHDFTYAGKEPGDCSDDQLWLVQAVYRYVHLTGDTDFLRARFPIAGQAKATRTLWDTILAILTYSGQISVGRHGLPLLDKADWNDTLRLDETVLKGPEKEKAYQKQRRKTGERYGAPWKNDLTESVMNACLLKIAADEAAEMAVMLGKPADRAFAAGLSRATARRLQTDAWKGNFFARCLINDQRGYTYLGARGDGLQLEPEMDGCYFLNSYSWPILAGAATEEQIETMLGVVERHLKTPAGLRLCTLVDFDKLRVQTGTALYFPGDRENGGVFKHAAMMAATASLQAAKAVASEALAARLLDLAFFMLEKAAPYATLEDPFVRKGNPRFCTQYNNSETGENIGPMLSGTASWLTLAVYEYLGVSVGHETLSFAPVLPAGRWSMQYTVRLLDATVHVTVSGEGKRRTGPDTQYIFDNHPTGSTVPRPHDGKLHSLHIRL